MNALDRRIRRLEGRGKPPPVGVPHVLDIDMLRNETVEDAKVRFAKRWGPIASAHTFLVVPEQPRNDEDDLAICERIERQQAALMLFVRQRPEPIDEAPQPSPFNPAQPKRRKQSVFAVAPTMN